MATSDVLIANLALSLLGEEPIISLTEDAARARTVNLWYEHVRDAVLQDHLWNSASGRVQLSLDAAVPAFGFNNQFALPSDFLRLVMLNNGEQPFRIEGKKLLTNATTARLRYIKKVTDPNQFEPMLISAIAARLAAEIAVSITGDNSLEDQMWQRYKEKIQAARGVDAQQGPVEVMIADDWVDARVEHILGEPGFRPIESS